jgi:large subunit ribosomal protein L24
MRRLTVGTVVVVTRGNDKGKRGKITRLDNERKRCVVEGVRSVKRHLRATQQRPGGILEVEAPISQSNVMPVDATSGKPTRVSIKVEKDKKVRAAKSGAVLTRQES